MSVTNNISNDSVIQCKSSKHCMKISSAGRLIGGNQLSDAYIVFAEVAAGGEDAVNRFCALYTVKVGTLYCMRFSDKISEKLHLPGAWA